MYTLISSAARNHSELWAYMDAVLRQLAAGSTDYGLFPPDVWSEAHPESVRLDRDAEKKSCCLAKQQCRVCRWLAMGQQG